MNKKLYVAQSYFTMSLNKKLSEHENGEDLVKAVKAIYSGDVNELYYISDRGDTGESFEEIKVYVCQEEMAVMIASIDGQSFLSRPQESYIKENNISLNREKTYIFDINWYAFDILSFPKLNSEYTEFLKKVKNNLDPKILTKVSKEDIKNVKEKLNERLLKENSVFYVELEKYNDFENKLYVMPTEDGEYFADRIVSISLRAEKSIYTYFISTTESFFCKNNVEDIVKNIFERCPKNEEVKLKK